MPLAVMMDVHVPASLTAELVRRGHDLLTAQRDGADQLEDGDLLDRAGALGRVLFTQDRDFLRIASEFAAAGRSHRGIVYAHQIGAGIGELGRDLDLVLSVCAAEELADAVRYLPLR